MKHLRNEIEKINLSLLELLNRRAQLVIAIQEIKTREHIPTFLPQRERAMVKELQRQNQGPFDNETINELFTTIFRASVRLMEAQALFPPEKEDQVLNPPDADVPAAFWSEKKTDRFGNNHYPPE